MSGFRMIVDVCGPNHLKTWQKCPGFKCLWIQPFENRTIQQPDMFGSFENRTCPVFECPIVIIKAGVPDWYLNTRIKKFLSSLFLCRNLWSDHFRSSSRYLCSGSRIKRKQREKMSEPSSFESSPDPEKNKSFNCSLCRESFSKAESLQDHYTGVEHARMMSRSTAGTTRPKDWGLYSQWNC